MEDILRYVGLWILSFLIGMNIYIFFKVRTHAQEINNALFSHYLNMGLTIKWIFINQTALFIMISVSRTQRLLDDAPLTWVDYVAIPLFISYILFNIMILKKYISKALD